MPRFSALSRVWSRAAEDRARLGSRNLPGTALALAMLFCAVVSHSARGVILWSDTTPRLALETGRGIDILDGAVKRDDASSDTLYFKFHAEALSDKTTEEYFAAFELFEGDIERLGVGNALKAWAYSAFFGAANIGETNATGEYVDLRSATPDPADDGSPAQYQFPQRGVGVTIVFKVQYVPGEDDLVTVWLNPDLGAGANEVYQSAARTTHFSANASFDEVRVRHGGAGQGWTFSDMAVGTAFSDFAEVSSARAVKAELSDRSASVSFNSWQKEHGLPQTPVRALAQTLDGYVWVGSDNGVSRFDGVRFVSFGMREGLQGRMVQALLGDRCGHLWIGSAGGGLIAWENGRVQNFGVKEGLPTNCIIALAEDGAGTIWVATPSGLSIRRQNRFVCPNGAEKFRTAHIAALCKDKNGDMLVGIRGTGVFRHVNGKFVGVDCPIESEAFKNPHCLLADRMGRLWIGAGEDLILCHDGANWQRYKVPRHLAKPFIAALAEDADGAIWAGSAGGGLLRVRDGRVAAISAAFGASGTAIGALFIDHEGKLWVGTDAGLNRMRSRVMYALGQNEGLGFGAVQGLAEPVAGVIWAVKTSDGLYRWDGRLFNRLNAAGLLPRNSQINALLCGRDGICWVAGLNGFFRYKDPVAAADEVKKFELAGYDVLALAEDSRGNLIAGTRQGKLFLLQSGKWTMRRDLAQTNPITALVPMSPDSLWIGTDGAGLYHLERGVYDHIDKADGLLSDVIRAVYPDAHGVVWIGTAGGGLSRWRDGRLSNFTTREGLPDDTISQILEDNEERLWLGTSGGIVCVSKAALDDFAAGRSPAIYARRFGRAEGMLSEECSSGFHAGLKTQSGQLWFSTTKGAVVVEPRAQPTNAFAPMVVLENVLVDGIPAAESIPSGGRKAEKSREAVTIRIKPGKHQVEFRYTGLSFDAPELLRFKYRLKGLDTDWIDAGQRRTALYSYVPAGDYRFCVTACNRDGIWTVKDAQLSMTVLRHFWQSWWFIGLAGISGLTAVGGTIRFVEKARLHKRLKRLEQERALERERTRIAQDLHDEMGAKLCRISFLSEHARQAELKPSELHDQIASISAASRDVLQSLDEIVWAVNPRNDTVEHAASYIGEYAQEYFRMTGIECALNIPSALPPYSLSSQIRHHLFLAMHEALTNILKHSEARHVEISMKCGDRALEVETRDDGKGFNITRSQTGGIDIASGGDGLRNMNQRLVDIGGLCQVESAPGCGTQIRFVLPLNGTLKHSKARP